MKKANGFIMVMAALVLGACPSVGVMRSGNDVINDAIPQGHLIKNVAAYLAAAPGGLDATDPVPLMVTLDLADTTDGWAALLAAIQATGKYVALDMSGLYDDRDRV